MRNTKAGKIPWNKIVDTKIRMALKDNRDELYLTEFKCTFLPEAIGELVNLKALYIDCIRQITTIPEDIGNLKQLQMLIINSNNSLTALPETISELAQLKELCLCSNPKLTSIPEGIGELAQLQTLVIKNNMSLTTLPKAIGNLSKLKILDLRNNQLTSLPEALLLLKNLQELKLSGNKALNIPLELCDTKKPQATLDYYFRVVLGIQKPLNEVKLLLVGRGGAGKTSLVQRLREDTFNVDETETCGISINTWNIKCGGIDTRVNIWDFAGLSAAP